MVVGPESVVNAGVPAAVGADNMVGGRDGGDGGGGRDEEEEDEGHGCSLLCEWLWFVTDLIVGYSFHYTRTPVPGSVAVSFKRLK